MTNRIEVATRALSDFRDDLEGKPGSLKHSYDLADIAKVEALIAIAEQLKVMNLWRMAGEEPAEPCKQYLQAAIYDGHCFSSDVAEALGIKEASE